MALPWPQTVWVVRHRQSAGNLARDEAHAAGLGEIDLAIRDVDVPLSPLGEEQAMALGGWFAQLPPERRPEVVLTSPYLRARQTADLIRRAGGLSDLAVAFCLTDGFASVNSPSSTA
jgi:probable phosphoglycerate mutase